jgi:hypothetical protein
MNLGVELGVDVYWIVDNGLQVGVRKDGLEMSFWKGELDLNNCVIADSSR